MAWRLGVDIGGTFTDFVLQNEQTGELVVDKQHGTAAKNPSLEKVTKEVIDQAAVKG